MPDSIEKALDILLNTPTENILHIGAPSSDSTVKVARLNLMSDFPMSPSSPATTAANTPAISEQADAVVVPLSETPSQHTADDQHTAPVSVSGSTIAAKTRRLRQETDAAHSAATQRYMQNYERLESVDRGDDDATAACVDSIYAFLVLSNAYTAVCAIGCYTFELPGVHCKIILDVYGYTWLHVTKPMDIFSSLSIGECNDGEPVFLRKNLSPGYYYILSSVNVNITFGNMTYSLVTVSRRMKTDKGTRTRRGTFTPLRPDIISERLMQHTFRSIPRQVSDKFHVDSGLYRSYIAGRMFDDSRFESLVAQTLRYCVEDLDIASGRSRSNDFYAAAREIDFSPVSFWRLAPMLHTHSNCKIYDKLTPALSWYIKYTGLKFADRIPAFLAQCRPSEDSRMQVSSFATTVGFYKVSDESIDIIWDRVLCQAFGDFHLSPAAWCIDRNHHSASKAWYMHYPRMFAQASVEVGSIQLLVGRMRTLCAQKPYLSGAVLISAYIVYKWAQDHGMFCDLARMTLLEFIVTTHESVGIHSALNLPLENFAEAREQLKTGVFEFNIKNYVVAIARFYLGDVSERWAACQRQDICTVSIESDLKIAAMDVSQTVFILTEGIPSIDGGYESQSKRRKITEHM